ncbi:hypothetical protein DFH07DRAFT_713672, partial [Mycena maculata]
TPHNRLLATNEPPQAAEIPLVESVVSKTAVRLAFLDAEMARLRDRLNQLDEERTELSDYHARNTGILSPLRRVPPEVLDEIFSWSLPSVTEALDRGFNTNNSPWVLSHISSRWRAIALSIPSLWSL